MTVAGSSKLNASHQHRGSLPFYPGLSLPSLELSNLFIFLLLFFDLWPKVSLFIACLFVGLGIWFYFLGFNDLEKEGILIWVWGY